jgi:hypothetical protein
MSQEFNIGDRVIDPEQDTATVLFIDEGYLWLKYDKGIHLSCRAAFVSPLDEHTAVEVVTDDDGVSSVNVKYNTSSFGLPLDVAREISHALYRHDVARDISHALEMARDELRANDAR